MKKRQEGAWVLLFTLLFWWQVSPVGAIENWSGLSESPAPVIITQLNQVAATAPQVYIVSPRSEEVIADTTVAVQLQVAGTPIFRSYQLGLGPHLHLLLDRVPTESVYDLSVPIILSNLSPGTHTLQVLANKPWHESWKNPQAFAQVTFHVLAKSTDSPNIQTPQLISVQPTAVGAEPWLLDFYVANAPSHVDAQHPLRQVADWRVRVTVNEQSFEVNRDEPLYLKGLRPGVNVLKLEYLNTQGQVADSAVRVVRYQPNGNDGLSRLVRNELSIDQALALFDPQSRLAVVPPSGNELIQGDRSPKAQAELSSKTIRSTQQPTMSWNQMVPPMEQGNQGMPSNPAIQNNPGMQTNPEIQFNPVMQGNSGVQNNPGIYGDSRSQNNPRIYGNSGTQNNPGTYGNSRTQSNPEIYGNSGAQNNPGIYGNSGTQNNPGVYGNSGMQNNPGTYGNSGMQNNPGTYGNSGMQNNPGTYGNSINPISPQSTSPAPSQIFANSVEIFQPKLPQAIAKSPSAAIASLPPINQAQKEIAANPQNWPPNISSKNIALLPLIQPQATSPNPRTTEPKELIAELAPKSITGSVGEVIDPSVTKQTEETTADSTPKVLPPNQLTTKSPTIPSSSNDAVDPLVPLAITEVDPPSLPLNTSDKALDFKVIGQELWHNTSIKIKQFTNQIPPLANSWSEKFRHWLSDRITAMRANPGSTTAVESAQPTPVRE
jgi:hypothetical protein